MLHNSYTYITIASITNDYAALSAFGRYGEKQRLHI